MFNEAFSNQLSTLAPLAIAFGAPCFFVLFFLYRVQHAGGNTRSARTLLATSLLSFVAAAWGGGILLML